ncbi:MAG TPA: apolipoprotein N-acyltransferase [bacterium]
MTVFLVLLSALLLSLSFHPLPLHFLAWVGLVPVLFVIDRATPRRAFAIGLAFGSCFALFSLFWIIFLQIPATVKLIMIFGVVLLFLYHGLFFAVSFAASVQTSLWCLPLFISGLELVKGIGEIGFPWLSLGYSQTHYPLVIQQASVYGLYGLSLWLVLLNVAVYKLLRARKWQYAIAAILIFCAPVVYGAFRMKSQAGGHRLVVGIVQPNIDPNLKFTRELRDQTFNRLLDLSARCVEYARVQYRAPCDIIIWPESATPIFLKSANVFQKKVFAFVDSVQTPLLSGTPIYDQNHKNIYNGAVLMEPGSVLRQEYRKVHLVPFGEHIPYDRYVPLFRKVDLGEGDYDPGSDFTVFRLKNAAFSCLICFESIFPELSRRFVREGAHFLVNITNDGWFGRISGSQQHNDMAILRAVENGVPLVRCANTGISMVTDEYGRILGTCGLFKEDILVREIYPDHSKTVYNTVGDLLPVGSLIIATALLLASIVAPFKKNGPPARSDRVS